MVLEPMVLESTSPSNVQHARTRVSFITLISHAIKYPLSVVSKKNVLAMFVWVKNAQRLKIVLMIGKLVQMELVKTHAFT